MATKPKAEIELTARNRVNEAVDAANRSLRGIERTAQFVTRAFAGLAAIQLGRRFLDIADQATQLENRLRLVTSSSAQLADVQQRLFSIAQDAGTSFASTVDLYARLTQSTQELAISQERLVRVTETISRALAVSGASAEEADRALVQLSQGLATGTLRGQDLNSVLSQAPRLAQAIADGLGVTVGRLRELGAEGKLSAEAVIGALESQAATIKREFESAVPTISTAVTRLGNSLVNLIATIDDATNSSTIFASVLDSIASGMDAIASASVPAATKSVAELNRELEQLQRFQASEGFWNPEIWLATQRRIEETQRAIDAARERERQAWSEYEALFVSMNRALERRRQEQIDAILQPIEVEHLQREAMRSLPDFIAERARREREAQEEQRRLAEERLVQLQEFLLTEEELELEAHRRRLIALTEIRMANAIDDERFADMSIQLAERTQERITEIQRREDARRKKFTHDAIAAQVAATLQGFAQLAQVADSGSRGLFAIHKALAIASAIVSTKKAVAEALATPPVPNVGLAKWTAALGAAQVAAIAATSFMGRGGGGAVAGNLGGGSSIAAPPPPPPVQLPELQPDRGSQTVVTVNIYGGINGLNSTEVATQIADSLRRVVEENDVIIIPPTSRQAADLASVRA